MRVLVVEDEIALADAVGEGLRREGFAVDLAHDGEEGLEKALGTPYDVIVLDRDLPAMSGDEMCEHLIRENRGSKILMLTAANGTSALVQGLSIGADDYLTKPFLFAELTARVRALQRRAGPRTGPVITSSGVRVDTNTRQVFLDDVPCSLTPKEYGVLEVIMGAQGRVVSAEELIDRVWDENLDPLSGVVRVVLVGLRRKIGRPELIQTIKGSGYRWSADVMNS